METDRRGEWVAVCDCTEGGCPNIRLSAAEVVVHEPDMEKLVDGIRAALGFESAAAGGLGGALVSHAVGVRGVARSRVLLTLASSEDLLLREIEALLAVVAAPFILLTPTPAHCTVRVEGVLRRNCCVFIPLSAVLTPGKGGSLGLTGAIDGILADFDRALVTRGEGLLKTVEGIGRDIKAVAKQKADLCAAKVRLEQMQSEGMFAFAKKIDRETRDIFFTILASGDVAKASRELAIKDSTLRSKIADWKKRGKDYAALAEFVRWRKAIHGQAGREVAKRLVSCGERDEDYPALIQDMLGELESFNRDNWEEKCEELADLLRASVS